MTHKAGFVNILGAPNVGKSTLMNALVGEKLSIIAPKAQTTRHRIRGILNGEDYQIVFTDTPGIMKPAYLLHEAMMKSIEDAVRDGDIFLYIVELGEREIKNEIVEKIIKKKAKLILLINKIDLGDQAIMEERVQHWGDIYPGIEILPVSASFNLNTDVLLKKIIKFLPESEPYFSKEELTDKPEKFFVSEIIREKIFLQYQKEVPYCTEVEIDTFEDEPEIVRIRAIIHVMRESQKAILLGHKGEAIKRVGISARKDIEEFVGKHVFLELRVKVTKDWRDNKNSLKRFGYEF
jgi:GTPase